MVCAPTRIITNCRENAKPQSLRVTSFQYLDHPQEAAVNTDQPTTEVARTGLSRSIDARSICLTVGGTNSHRLGQKLRWIHSTDPEVQFATLLAISGQSLAIGEQAQWRARAFSSLRSARNDRQR